MKLSLRGTRSLPRVYSDWQRPVFRREDNKTTEGQVRDDALELRCLLKRALDRIPRGEQTGILLSGGIDSSSLTCLLLSEGQRVRSVSASFVGWPMYDETEYVEMIKARYQNLELNYYTTLGLDLIAELKERMQFCQRPLKTGTLLLEYQLLKLARRLGMRYVISGQFGDELLAGYELFFLSMAHDAFLRGHYKKAAAYAGEYLRRSRLQEDPYLFYNFTKFLIQYGGFKRTRQKLLASLEYIAETSRKAAHQLGIELFLPYADPEVIKFCLQLDVHRLIDRNVTKVILREAVADIVPEGILQRRQKFCFYAPDAVWLLQNRAQIQSIPDRRVQREYRRFLRNPQRRKFLKLWFYLSRGFLTAAAPLSQERLHLADGSRR